MIQAGWRPMEAGDIGSVARISDAVHGRYTERAEVYAERLSLYPAGCFLFEKDGAAAGYMVSHPWVRAAPPTLDAMLGAFPANADCFYLHDLALLATARGTGAGKAATQRIIAQARAAAFAEIRLVAINGAEGFWASQGFVPVAGKDDTEMPGSYGDEALFMQRWITD
ncbi:MAG TPA: GNAT family N-acetyltransferase [Sphingobium sp.]